VAPLTGTERSYAVAMSELWSGLARTLARLDVAAAEPSTLDDRSAGESLRRLQYALHLATEHAYGLEPPATALSAHAELADALVCARDATAGVAEAVSIWGADGVEPLLPEWRGALFRVRLARTRLAAPAPTPAAAEPTDDTGIRAPLIAFALALAGALAFVAGATLALWPLWAAGLVAVCVSVVAYRP
jgi:hypothetical protein